jgi:hypothetical protein
MPYVTRSSTLGKQIDGALNHVNYLELLNGDLAKNLQNTIDELNDSEAEIRLLEDWLRGKGFRIVSTHVPAAVLPPPSSPPMQRGTQISTPKYRADRAQELADAMERVKFLELLNNSLAEKLDGATAALKSSKSHIGLLEKWERDFEDRNPPTIHLSAE